MKNKYFLAFILILILTLFFFYSRIHILEREVANYEERISSFENSYVPILLFEALLNSSFQNEGNNIQEIIKETELKKSSKMDFRTFNVDHIDKKVELGFEPEVLIIKAIETRFYEENLESISLINLSDDWSDIPGKTFSFENGFKRVNFGQVKRDGNSYVITRGSIGDFNVEVLAFDKG